MVLAPLAVLPLGALAAGVAWGASALGTTPLLAALLCVGTLALGSRALHWDGLADTVDGLTASYSAARSLEVMRTGTSGPAGVLAIVLLAGIQVVALATVLEHHRGWIAAGLLVLAARSALAFACVRGVPSARPEGLGALHIGSVPRSAAAASSVLAALACGAAGWLVGDWWPAVLAWPVALVVVAVLLRRCVRRLGGITGDVLGACVEVALATVLVVASL